MIESGIAGNYKTEWCSFDEEVGWLNCCMQHLSPKHFACSQHFFVLGIFCQSDEANFCQNFTFVHLRLKIIDYDHLHRL